MSVKCPYPPVELQQSVGKITDLFKLADFINEQ